MIGIRKPTAAQIKAYRDEHGCGITEARAALMKQWRKEVLTVLRVQCEIGFTHQALTDLIEYLLVVEGE